MKLRHAIKHLIIVYCIYGAVVVLFFDLLPAVSKPFPDHLGYSLSTHFVFLISQVMLWPVALFFGTALGCPSKVFAECQILRLLAFLIPGWTIIATLKQIGASRVSTAKTLVMRGIVFSASVLLLSLLMMR